MSSTVIFINSSPPRFARSPTPAEPSSRLAVEGTPIRDGAKRFKSSTQVRDSFSGGFSGARALLVKTGAANIPLRSPRFKSTSARAERDISPSPQQSTKFTRRQASSQAEQVSAHFKRSKPSRSRSSSDTEADNEAVARQHLKFDSIATVRKNERQDMAEEPAMQPQVKAVPRRMEWTPPKATDVDCEPGVDVGAISALGAYAYTAPGNVTRAPPEDPVEFLRRKQMDIVATTTSATATFANPSISNSTAGKVRGKGKSKGRAAPKKPLTITGLATAAYSGHNDKVPPMLEYLTSTQPAICEDGELSLDVSMKNPNKPKTTRTKKTLPKSRLQSPRSALQTTSEQAYLFGAASQLARDESPVQTSKVSNSILFLSSDPLSPLRSQPKSTMSPQPKFGTAKVTRRRDLWEAGWRDEGNALLHMETYDMIDSPAVRQALAGKDALTEPIRQDGPGLRSIQSRAFSAAVAQTPHVEKSKSEALFDIDDFETPGLPKQSRCVPYQQVRALHSVRELAEPQKTTSARVEDEEKEKAPKAAKVKTTATPKTSAPTMPKYEGWSDKSLKKKIAGYGFKPIKKRETMISKLQECWKNLNDVDQQDVDEVLPDTLKHSDFVSKVHDLSSRPVPKVKKSRAKKKSDPTDDTPTTKEPKKPRPKRKSDSMEETTAAKAPPKRRKTAAKEEGAEPKPKAPRKPRAKKVLSEEKIIDIDDIQDSETAPKLPSAAIQSPATPPPTEQKLTFLVSPIVREPSPAKATGTESNQNTILTPRTTPAPDMLTQIHAAIHHVPLTPDEDSRDHQTHPTWREKILMYDPIVLEELTLWLNTEGFRAIGEDREIGPLEVRNWCERESICCYGVGGGWRGTNRRGKGE